MILLNNVSNERYFKKVYAVAYVMSEFTCFTNSNSIVTNIRSTMTPPS